MTDYKSIVPRALSGDAAALDELYKSTCRAVYFTCVCLLKNAEDAEDMTQNTYITAFAKLKTLENPERFEPWIKRVAANLCKDFLIKKGAHPSEPLDEESFEETGENFLPEEYAEATEKREIVMKIMRENLSDALYQTVILFYFDELSIAEIAEEMGCPEGTVKYRLNAARAKIKKGVLDYEKKSGDKLYALVGVPFLALLLSRQAEAAEVPALDIMSVITQNSPYVPDTSAVNSAGRIGGKMSGLLKTVKAKIIAGACAAAIVGGGVTAGVLIANNAHKDDPNRPAYSASGTSKPSPGNSGNSGSGVDYSSSRFWFARQSWDEPPRSWFEGGVLADKRDIQDVDLHKIDGISAPFYAYKVLDEANDWQSSSFADCLNSQWIIEPGGHVGIGTQHVESGTPKPLYDGLGAITLFNFDDEPRTVAYCFEQNWWNNHQNSEYPPDETRALGLDGALRDTGPAPKEDAMLDEIKAKFGTPSFIRCGSIHEDDKELDPKTALYKEVERELDPKYEGLVAVYYDMIYDYGDILMIISVHEQIFSETKNKTDVYYVEFWPRECWEHRKDIEPFYGGENDSEQMFRPYEGTESAPPKPVSTVPSTESISSFWYARQSWNEAPRSSFEGGLLVDNRKTIDPEFLDGICAPYYCSLLNTTGHTANKFTEVLMADKDIPDYDYTDIITQYASSGERPEFSGAKIIRVFNFDNIPHSLYDCYENGWWKITVDEDYRNYPATTALGLSDALRDDTNAPDESALLDAIRAKFGTPDLVRYIGTDRGARANRKQAMLEDIAKGANPSDNEPVFLTYDLLYDFDDIVMIVTVTEQKRSTNEYTTVVDYVEFWSPLCLENADTVADLEGDDYRAELAFFKPYEP